MRIAHSPGQEAREKGPVSIERPVFIIGVERSGTTLLYSLLANHPAFYWLSRLDSLLPQCPFLSTWIRNVFSSFGNAAYVAVPDTISRSTGTIPPSECLPYWRNVFGWGTEQNYLIEDDHFSEQDISRQAQRYLHRDLRIRLHTADKRRLLFKQPGFSLKIRYLDAVFPDALFVHMVRHPIDNLTSLVKAKQASRKQFWGIKIPGWRELVDLSPEEQGVQQINKTLSLVDCDIRQVHDWSSRYYRVRYEELTSSPLETLTKVLDFCDVELTSTVQRATAGISHHTRPRNDTLMENLSCEGRLTLDRLVNQYLS